MRAALEVLALRHAVQRMTAESLAAAHQALLDSTPAVDIVALEASNRRFHRALLVPCGMPRLLSSIDHLHAASSRFLLPTWQTAVLQPRSDHEHVDRKTVVLGKSVAIHV